MPKTHKESRLRALSWGGAALLVITLALNQLSSENVHLSTYYPAPSGVYTSIVTTGRTHLARDTVWVGRCGLFPAGVHLLLHQRLPSMQTHLAERPGSGCLLDRT